VILVDRDILSALSQEEIQIVSTDDVPFDADVQVGPASIDLRLGTALRRYSRDTPEENLSEDSSELIYLSPDSDFLLQPFEFWLANTLETVMIPPHLAGLLTGRSSFARLGLVVQCTQDFIQPGYAETVPLQLLNVSPRPIPIRSHIRVCQLILVWTSSASAMPYFARPEAKYTALTQFPEPSRLGVELGTEQAALVQTPQPIENPRLELVLDEWKTRFTTLETAGESLTERLRRLETGLIEAAALHGDVSPYLRRLVKPPGVSDCAARSSFREDMAIEVVKEFLLRETGSQERVHILDACCGLGSWIKMAASALGSHSSRLAYTGIDVDSETLHRLDLAMASHRGRFAEFRCLLRSATDLEGIPGSPFHIIFLHNTLHELCPSKIPAILSMLARLLRPGVGRLSIIDMETLPKDDPEAIAITWQVKEVIEILESGGFVSVDSKHQKSVPVYSIEAAGPGKAVQETAIASRLRSLLQRKLERAVDERLRCPKDPGLSPADLKDWLLQTAAVARITEALHLLSRVYPMEQ